jgi:rhodanese-related sulfurtransferase
MGGFLNRAAVALTAAMLGFAVPVPPAGAGGLITPDEAQSRLAAGRIVLIDVRSPREWRRTGVPEGSRTITVHDPGGARAFVRHVLAAVGGDKSAPVALICASGVRSARARLALERSGFTDVYDVSAGMLGNDHASGWLDRGLPTRPCDRC